MRTIYYPPNSRGDATEEEGCTSNKISYGRSVAMEIQMFALSQIRISNLFFLFVIIIDQIYKTDEWARLSTLVPLVLVIGTQAVIRTVAYLKDRKRMEKINERADFKLAEAGKEGALPQFRPRSLDYVKPGDLLSFEPKLEKVNIYLM